MLHQAGESGAGPYTGGYGDAGDPPVGDGLRHQFVGDVAKQQIGTFGLGAQGLFLST